MMAISININLISPRLIRNSKPTRFLRSNSNPLLTKGVFVRSQMLKCKPLYNPCSKIIMSIIKSVSASWLRLQRQQQLLRTLLLKPLPITLRNTFIHKTPLHPRRLTTMP